MSSAGSRLSAVLRLAAAASWAGLPCAMLCSCATHHLIRSDAPATVKSIQPLAIRGPYVPAGTPIVVTLRTTLSTTSSLSGEPFGATIDQPLIDDRAEVVAYPGARVVGHVVSATNDPAPQLVLDFDALETRLGPAPLVVTVRDVQRRGTSLARVERSLLSSAPSPLPPQGVPITSESPDQAVVVPAGARMTLELTRPLFLPGTQVERVQ